MVQQGGSGPDELAAHADLSQAGAVVDKAIEYMMGRNMDPIAIASALLGGSLGLLGRTMGDDAIERVLGNALASVRSGELRYGSGPEDDDLPAGPPAGGHA